MSVNAHTVRGWTDADYIAYWKSRSVTAPNGCWEWHGFYRSESKVRYGEVSCRGKKGRVHRWMYRLVKGPIAPGLVVMHKCDNSICINPDHLELGTQGDNCAQARVRGRYWHHENQFKVCKHGHEFTAENTYRDARGFRMCRACQRIRMRSPEYRNRANERQRLRRAGIRQSKATGERE